jgi:hypothetical protein
MRKSFGAYAFSLLACLVIVSCDSCFDGPKRHPEPDPKPAPEPTPSPKDSFTKSDAKNFVIKFYSSLELSEELNERAYNEGGVKFNTSEFYSCVNSKSVFSKKRLENLTGDDYHYYYDIKLESIIEIQEKSGSFEVLTAVEYGIYETGAVTNIEKLTIDIEDNKFIVRRWEDVRVETMEIAEYEGLENYSKNDFYRQIGSVNK